MLSPENNILVIPVSLKSSQLNFNGAFIFKITPTTIKLLNAVDHLLQPNDVFDNRRVERSLIIEDNLYTKSKCLIRINEISNYFDEVKDVQLSC